MLFIWTSEGGPLQYVGLGLFFLQVLPRIFPDLTPLHLLAMVVPGAVLVSTFQAWQTGALSDLRQGLVHARTRVRQRIQQWTGVELSAWGLSTLTGVLVGSTLAILMSLDAYWWSALSQLAAIGVVVHTHFRGPLARHQAAEQTSRRAKWEELTQLVQEIPVEDFVPEEAITAEQTCSVHQLKQMLYTRGVTREEVDTILDRQNLVECLQHRRKFSDSCCICFEPYQAGEPIRVLPKCGHELHIECLEKWVHTFASALKRSQQPSCPLCKEGLEC